MDEHQGEVEQELETVNKGTYISSAKMPLYVFNLHLLGFLMRATLSVQSNER